MSLFRAHTPACLIESGAGPSRPTAEANLIGSVRFLLLTNLLMSTVFPLLLMAKLFTPSLLVMVQGGAIAVGITAFFVQISMRRRLPFPRWLVLHSIVLLVLLSASILIGLTSNQDNTEIVIGVLRLAAIPGIVILLQFVHGAGADTWLRSTYLRYARVGYAVLTAGLVLSFLARPPNAPTLWPWHRSDFARWCASAWLPAGLKTVGLARSAGSSGPGCSVSQAGSDDCASGNSSRCPVFVHIPERKSSSKKFSPHATYERLPHCSRPLRTPGSSPGGICVERT